MPKAAGTRAETRTACRFFAYLALPAANAFDANLRLPMKKLLLLLLGLTLQARAATPPPAASLEFIENKGQWNSRVQYVAPLPGGQRLFAETTGFTLALLADGGPAQHNHGGPKTPAPAPESTVRGHAVSVRFAGAAAVVPTATDVTPERRNYLLGASEEHWARNVRSYRSLHYANLWPGVNARLYESPDQHLEYDFEVAPGATPAAIALRHEGATGLALDRAGNLLVRTSVGTVLERTPQAWQLDGHGQRHAVACRYVLAGQEVRFALGRYDATRPLTIDPVVVFATYSGSTADNWGFTATYDDDGNLYSGGIAFGVGYPASPGAFQTRFAGLVDIALIKYRTSASGPAARVWATYLGGNSSDFPHSLVVNAQNELLLLGSTGSPDYPTTAGAVQRTFAGGSYTAPFGYEIGPYDVPNGSDLVVTRLSENGATLLGSTYLGGSGNDGLLPLDPTISAESATPQLPHNYGDPFRGDILVDAADNVYIASHTTSSNFPVTQGFTSTYRGGTSDGVVCKLTPGLTALTWSSFLGGSGADAAYSLQLEPTSGDVYVAGGTLSPNFPTTAGAYRSSRQGNVDGFAARISASGSSLLRATYVGTSAYDQAYFLQLGTDGGVYLLGQTRGAFPVSAGLYNTVNGSQFIQKLDANLGSSLLSTVFGAAGATAQRYVNLSPTAFLVDRCDRVYLCGWGGLINQTSGDYLAGNTSTLGLPTTPGAAQTATDGNDFYLAQFAAGLTGLEYGTFYGYVNASSGGEHVDGGTSRFDPRGIVYQAVCSCFSPTGFPIPPGANTYSTTNNTGGGACNNAAFVLNFQPSIANAGADQSVCATAGPQLLTGAPAGGIWSGPGVTGTVATGFYFNPSVALVGVQTLTYTVLSTGLCTTTDTRRVTVTAPPTVVFTPLLQTLYCPPTSGAPPLPTVPLTATPAGGTFSGPGVSGSLATGFVFAPGAVAPGTVQLTYSLNAGGCVVQATQSVTVASPQVVTVGVDTVVCAVGSPAFWLRGSPAGGTFSGPGVSGSVATGFVFTPTPALLGTQTITYSALSAAGCPATGTRRITVGNPPAVAFLPLQLTSFCLPTTLTVPLAGTPAGGTFSGPGVSGSVATGFVFTPSAAPQGPVQLVYTYAANGCTVQASQVVNVGQTPTVSLRPDTVLCADSRQPFALRGSPAGGTFSGPGVSGSVASGFVFTPPTGFTGSVMVSYTAVSGVCSATATRRISAAPLPSIRPTWLPVACAETRLAPLTVHFDLGNPGLAATGATVVWDFGDGAQTAELNPTHTYATPGNYYPTVSLRYNQARCETLTQLPLIEVRERKVPNVITPNGDRQNETFQLGPDCPPRIQIYSRWGQKVYEAAAYHDEWDAAGQPAGVYYYLLTYPDGHRAKGWVEVIR